MKIKYRKSVKDHSARSWGMQRIVRGNGSGESESRGGEAAARKAKRTRINWTTSEPENIPRGLGSIGRRTSNGGRVRGGRSGKGEGTVADARRDRRGRRPLLLAPATALWRRWRRCRPARAGLSARPACHPRLPLHSPPLSTSLSPQHRPPTPAAHAR